MITELISREVYPPEITAWTVEEKNRQAEAGRHLLLKLRKAIDEGEKSFSIPPGDYRFPGEHDFILEDVGDFSIDAEEVTFWFTPRARIGMHFRHCRRVSLSGLTIDMDGLPFLQGTIEQIGRERRELTVKLDEYFIQRYLDRPPIKSFRVMFLDADGHAETDNIDFRPDLDNVRFDGKDRLIIPVWNLVAEHWNSQLRPPQAGDRIALGMRQEGGMLMVDGCGEMAFADITIYASQGFAFFEAGHGDGGNRYQRCRLVRRSGTSRLLAGAADCFHSLDQRRGPVVENCEFSWAMDDLMNIHGFFQVILSKNGDREIVVAAPHGTRYEIGSPVKFYLPPFGKPIGEAIVVEFEKLVGTDGATTALVQQHFLQAHGIEIRNFPEGYPCRVKFDRAITAEPFDLAASYDYCGAGAIIQNNHLHDGHVRGILVKSKNVRVSGNRIERIALSGIAVKPELYWLEGPMPQDLDITGNRLVDCAFDYTGLAAIIIQAGFCTPPADRLTGEACLANITVRNNTIERCHSGPGILIANCIKPIVEDNEIIHPFSNPKAKGKIAFRPRLDLNYDVPVNAADLAVCEQPYYAIFYLGSRDVVSNDNLMREVSGQGLALEGFGPWLK